MSGSDENTESALLYHTFVASRSSEAGSGDDPLPGIFKL
ncbi:hypothetical protein M2277_000288 [Paenibacillus sp. LBL]|nr:hypothetical protein [Paenibacillus sp. LBL]